MTTKEAYGKDQDNVRGLGRKDIKKLKAELTEEIKSPEFYCANCARVST